MQVTIVKPGLLSTIQDLGRSAFLAEAVPISGAMDPLSARLANLSIGNLETDAVIEFTYGNASFHCDTDILLAFCGAGATLMVGNEKLPAARALFLPAKTTVTLINNENGARTYLAVAGGWDLPLVLLSRSTYLQGNFGGYNGRALKMNDVLNNQNDLTKTSKIILSELKGTKIKFTSWGVYEVLSNLKDKNNIRIIPGREFSWFEAQSINDFLCAAFLVDIKSDRMGISLKGPLIKRINFAELLSTAVCPGTIQVNGNGELILLMADCQTTGGYPRIAQVAMVDLPKCAQLKPGDPISFTEISYLEAEQLYLEQEVEMKKLAATIYMKY